MLKRMKKAFILFLALFIRAFVQPIIFFFPKKNNIVFIGFSDSYIGNCRYQYEYMRYKNIEVYFITNSKNVFEKYNKKYGILFIKSFKAQWIMMTAKIIVTDSTTSSYINLITYRAKKVQLWHGNGMKKIGILAMTKIPFIKHLRYFLSYITRTIVKYDLLYFTSNYAYDNRKGSFKFKSYKLNGQPRNDLLFERKPKRQINENFNVAVDNYNKIILYVPTWRENKLYDNYKNIKFDLINEYCKKNLFIFVIKLHPEEKSKLQSNSFSNVILLNNKSDLYTFLPYTDTIITDYSSIYFDYLLLDKPIIFFPFDKEDYLTKQRNIVYDYEEITPGKHVFDTNELIEEIDNLLIKNNDNYKEDRKKIRDLFYKYQDNNSRERATNDILELLGK